MKLIRLSNSQVLVLVTFCMNSVCNAFTKSYIRSTSSPTRLSVWGSEKDGRSFINIDRNPFSILFSTMKGDSLAEKVLENPKWPDIWPYNDEVDFSRMDESDDGIFYEQPRLCYHIDDFAVKSLTEYYRKNFKDGEDVLDICSSWVSHYPSEWKGNNVCGLGMNEYELSQNTQLTSYAVKDLNDDPTFPYEDNSFDKVTCVVSVDYLNKPKQVFSEIGRVLRPGGVCMLAMSNRCFPTKAFQIWLQTNDLEHIFIAGSFFHYSGLFDPPKCDDISPNPGMSDPMYIVKASKK